VFKGDSADMCAVKFPLCQWGDKQTVKRVQTVSEDPHRREQKFMNNFVMKWFPLEEFTSSTIKFVG
jgi:hypothetical protein